MKIQHIKQTTEKSTILIWRLLYDEQAKHAVTTYRFVYKKYNSNSLAIISILFIDVLGEIANPPSCLFRPSRHSEPKSFTGKQAIRTFGRV